ncbi:unnamed protein product [Dicrocoelium dendriticum]|nr:unnamed protein product [Dicrocoelium dendriticum]
MMSDPDTSSDSSHSCGSEEGDTALLEKVNFLKAQLTSCPTLYESHVELISSLRELGNLEDLRAARESMHSVYPLSPKLWLDWFEDELKIASSVEEMQGVEDLFKRAVEDYDDPSIWLEYCLFKIGRFSPESPESIRAVEDAFTLALSHQGLNVASGSVIWEAYRDFQTVLLEYFKVNSPQLVEEHVKCMDRLFRRQLSIPSLSIQSTFKAYEEFLEQYGKSLYESDQESLSPVPADCMKDYEAALAQLELLQPFEDKIETSDNDASSFSAWTAYLDWIVSYRHSNSSNTPGKSKIQKQTKGFDPAHICCLFERSVTVHCLHAEIWLRFINYLEDKLPSDRPRLLRVLARSVRNCPWSLDLWDRYALVSEAMANEEIANHATNGLNGQSDHIFDTSAFAKIIAVYDTALSAGLRQASDILHLWFNYCAFGVRRLLRMEPSTPEWNNGLENLRATFERAHHSLREMFHHEADPDDTLYQFHAFVEAKYARDLGKARSVWSRLMQQPGRGTKTSLWLAYLTFECNWGDVKHFLRVARMAINSIGQHGVSAFSALVQLGCQCGLEVSHILDLKSRIRQRLHELEQQAASKNDPNLETQDKRSAVSFTWTIHTNPFTSWCCSYLC